jgi:hypothetical protein
MKPLPAQTTHVIKANEVGMPSLPVVLNPGSTSYSTANRRASTCSTQRAYPVLLFISTAAAAVFCLMYITKPFIQASATHPEHSFQLDTTRDKPTTSAVPEPSKTEEKEGTVVESPRDAGVSARSTSPPATYEQTNLRIQHILTAEAPGGLLSKIDIDVPVLYQSRNLRWTPDEVAEARELLIRLANYQEKCRLLRSEGADLLGSWNRLIEQSIPSPALRADSPSLTSNQVDAADAPRPAGLDTNELIQIQPAGK